MTFVLPLKTESCPVHSKSRDAVASPSSEEEFPALKETPAALKDRRTPVPEEQPPSASSAFRSDDLRLLSSYVELLSGAGEPADQSDGEGFRTIPPPADFSSGDSETEMLDLSGNGAGYDVAIRSNPRSTISPKVTVPVLRTFLPDDATEM